MSKVHEFHEKPSKHSQWQERQDRPISGRVMTAEDIEDHRVNLVKSYKCDDSEITFEFHKVVDENDEDREDYLWLKYYMKHDLLGRLSNREIFSMKIPIPEAVKRMANIIRQQKAMRTSAKTAAPAEPAAAPARPTLKKPARKKTAN